MAEHLRTPDPSVTVPCGIVPPYLLEALSRSDDTDTAARARRTLAADEDLRRRRRSRAATSPSNPSGDPAPEPVPAGQGAPQRVISDARGSETLPGEVVRREGADASADATVNEAYDGLGDTWSLYFEAYQRDSLDGRGLPLLASVHYGQDYDNAFWDGSQMVFGDGDGTIFTRFTASLDVIGHELTHGVTELTAGLVYQGQSGALNESVSDVFGSLVKQHHLGQTADQADWLIGAELLTDAVKGRALRDMLNPGTAYDDPQLGKDPQPASMAGYVDTAGDNGGVHINSGIPNRAFALAARSIGGPAWVGAGQVWYDVLTGDISADCDFATFAGLTVTAAGARFGDASSQQQAVTAAWTEVGVLGAAVDPAARATATPSRAAGAGSPAPHRPDGELRVTRTGGFAGIARETTVGLDQLSADDAERWVSLLSGERVRSDPGEEIRPDAFVYEVRYRHGERADGLGDAIGAGMELSLPEQDLPAEVHDLLRRTLDLGEGRTGVPGAP